MDIDHSTTTSPLSTNRSAANQKSPADSLHVKTSVVYHLESLLDLAFLSSALVLPLALALAGYGFWLGEWLLAGLALIVAVGAAVVFYGRYIAPWQLRTAVLVLEDSRIEVNHISPQASISNLQSQVPNLSAPTKLKVVFFSDLHLANIKKRAWVQRVVDAANLHKPDVVLIGGDFVGILGKHTFEDLLTPFKNLHAPLGVYAILGNHDYGLPGINHAADIERALTSVGVRLMCNDAINLDERVQLLTVDELWGDLDDIDHAFALAHAKQRGHTQRIFLGHNPDLMTKFKAHQRANISIFGHTHHGQIYLPFWPSMAVPIHSQYYRGVFETPHGPVYVSAGAGDARSPIRILTWPEIVVFEV